MPDEQHENQTGLTTDAIYDFPSVQTYKQGKAQITS